MKTYLSKLRWNPLFTFIIIASLFFLGWGATGHKIINKAGARDFPDLTVVTPSIIQRLVDSASVPDNRSNEPWEPKHFMDMDRLAEFTTHTITHDRNALFQEYGEAYIRNTVGFLPWVIDSVLTALTNQMRSQDWNRVWSTASDLGHYIGDAHQPLHATQFYNGYPSVYGSGSSGVHSRYESSMINQFQSNIIVDSSAVHFIPHPLDTVFAIMYQSNSYIDSIYIADQIARSYGATNGSIYIDTLWGRASSFTILQFRRAAVEYGSYLYTAWVNAGRPTTTIVPLTASNWELPIQATDGSILDTIFTIGVSPTSTNGYDVQDDIPRPPRDTGLNYLEIYSINSGGNYPAVLGNKYAKDYRDSTNPSWNIAVESGKTGTITLSWNKTILVGLPEKVKMVLVDNSLALSLDMKITSTYSFTYTSKRSFSINAITTPVKEDNRVIPAKFTLAQNYPNPFNPSTTLSFSIGTLNYTTIKVFTTQGREIATLVNEIKSPGTYSIQWNAEKFPSGVYFCRLMVGGNSITRKMVLIK